MVGFFFGTVISLGDESINLEDIQLLSSPSMVENRLVDCDGMLRVKPIFWSFFEGIRSR
jgi:hypothetical protein